MDVRVVDASAMAALLFDEPAAEFVAAQIRDFLLVAPTLIEYELGNTCWKKARRHPEHAEAYGKALGTLSALPISLCSVSSAAVLALAVERNLTFYDASYLWLADDLGIPLISLDERLIEARG